MEENKVAQDRLNELIEQARRLDYDVSSTEDAHNRLDVIAEALAILVAQRLAEHRRGQAHDATDSSAPTRLSGEQAEERTAREGLISRRKVTMKTVFTILFLCSVAVSQDATVTQSSEQTVHIVADIVRESCANPETPSVKYACNKLRDAEWKAIIDRINESARRSRELTDAALTEKSTCKRSHRARQVTKP